MLRSGVRPGHPGHPSQAGSDALGQPRLRVCAAAAAPASGSSGIGTNGREQGWKNVRGSEFPARCAGFPQSSSPSSAGSRRLRSRGLREAEAAPCCVTRRLQRCGRDEKIKGNGRLKGNGSLFCEESLILLDGRHEFPFSFQLPQEPLVTSFTGKYGSIQYYVKAILERPAAPDQSVQTELQVISHIDISSPALLTPVLRSQEKMVGCWFFTSGPVSLSAKIERKGYCNGEAIPIYAEIENCSSRLIVPKAAIFQTQTYLASGKTKTFRQMVANVRGNHIASGSTDTWNGKTLKIPPVSPSILDCCIIRVEYSLAVYIHIPGAKKLMTEMPLVIGTIPCIGFSSRNSSITSQFSMDMSWLALTMPEHPEAPPNYADVVSEEEFSRHVPAYPPPIDCEEQLCCPVFAYIQEFRFQPPPLYSEIDPHPTDVEEIQPVSFML
ncbi:PREDICTED: arrestin domain-containing protein 4 [Tauraco erythrolophus]|uniref:arrestin domain-containing protein 4 n=1 Tax=Tauraco erythrolophus TaxID=121530 RepID=UPI000523B579|nr:PREDICTED: arrestin domain-containing protein 4 [Tauraco erythrolophus]